MPARATRSSSLAIWNLCPSWKRWHLRKWCISEGCTNGKAVGCFRKAAAASAASGQSAVGGGTRQWLLPFTSKFRVIMEGCSAESSSVCVIAVVGCHSFFKCGQQTLSFTFAQVLQGREAWRWWLIAWPQVAWPWVGGGRAMRCNPQGVRRGCLPYSNGGLFVTSRGELLGALVGRRRALGEWRILGGLGKLLEEVQLGPATRCATAAVCGNYVTAVGTRHCPKVSSRKVVARCGPPIAEA